MGNNCVGPSATGSNGFFASVSLWRPARPADAPPLALPLPPSAPSDQASGPRVQSTNLLADSVLKRDVNTARLKDIYTIGKKLG
ncbi:hypothetical protein GUJ93_ZPchr0006g44952 [Zizania palustris]|uniref:Uncharacterized protein n=1 Tax=Zizania palustris TaxID=103762 RepID=A0A8J5SB38_ZIZPA|nr:hypothetical protein GUJ93_ZPchr0006g44952 [Zizania palustris]